MSNEGDTDRTPVRGLYRRLAGGLPRPRAHDAVLAHLQVLLNTHIGESLASPTLGILDFADIVHGFPASAQVLAHSIRTTVLLHEPRLRDVAVQSVDSSDPLALAFEISARFNDAVRSPLRARTELSASGHFQIRRS